MYIKKINVFEAPILHKICDRDLQIINATLNSLLAINYAVLEYLILYESICNVGDSTVFQYKIIIVKLYCNPFIWKLRKREPNRLINNCLVIEMMLSFETMYRVAKYKINISIILNRKPLFRFFPRDKYKGIRTYTMILE